MNDVTLPGLIVPVEARIDKLEKALKRASQAQSRAARQMEDRAKRSADRMAKSYEGFGSKAAGALSKLPLPGLGVGLAGLAGAGIGAGLGIAAGQVRETVRGIAEIGNEARRAGVAVEDFQRLSYVAAQNRVSVDALTDGLKELNLRADEFVLTGKGSGADAFQRLGYSASDLAKKLKDPSKLFLEIVGRLEHLDKAAQIRIADEVFGGTGGERFVEMLGRGQASISAMMSKASVLTEEQIAKADALDRRYTALTESLHRGWQRAALGAADFVAQVMNLRLEGDKLAASDLFRNAAQAPQILGPGVSAALDGNSQAVADNAREIGDLLALYERFAAKSDALAPYLQRLSNELANMGDTQAADTLFETAGAMQRLSEKLDAGEISAGDFESVMADLIRKAQDALSSVSDLDDNPTFTKVIARLGDLWDALEGVRAKAAEARAALPGGSLPVTTGTGLTVDQIEMPPGEFAPTSSPRPKPAPPMISENVATPKKGGGGGREHDSYARAVADLQAEKAALDAEAVALVAAAAGGKKYGDAIEFARKKAELLAAAQRDGKAITPELSAEVDRLAQSYVEAGRRAETAAEKMKKIEERGQAGADALSEMFTSVLSGSMSAEEAVASLLMKLAEAQLNQAFLGLFSAGAGGGFAEWIGGLLGFADGGYTGDGHKFAPAGVVHKGEYVLSKAATSRIGVDSLDALHDAALRGYSDGGLVGGMPGSAKSLTGSGRKSDAQVISIAPSITVNASGGTPEANADLAAQVARETEASMRALVQQELVKQMRPGGMLR
jgi:Phage-related minor tail protein.